MLTLFFTSTSTCAHRLLSVPVLSWQEEMRTMGGIRSSTLSGDSSALSQHHRCPVPHTLHVLLRTSAFLEILVSVRHWRLYKGDST